MQHHIIIILAIIFVTIFFARYIHSLQCIDVTDEKPHPFKVLEKQYKVRNITNKHHVIIINDKQTSSHHVIHSKFRIIKHLRHNPRYPKHYKIFRYFDSIVKCIGKNIRSRQYLEHLEIFQI